MAPLRAAISRALTARPEPLGPDLIAILDFTYPAGLVDADGRFVLVNHALAHLLDEEADAGIDGGGSDKDLLGSGYVFSAPLAPTPDRSDARFLAYLEPRKVSELLHETIGGEPLTDSETATLVLVARGMSIREIAAIHGTTYETRRSQLKSIQRKLAIGSSKELVYQVNSQIGRRMFADLFEIMRRNQVNQSDRADLRLIDRHYGPTARVLECSGREQDRLVALEIGPAQGTPVLVFHSIIYPCFPLPRFVQELYRRNLRMIVPARPGYLGSTLLSGAENGSPPAQVEAIDRLMDLASAGRDVTVLGLLRGAPFAMQYLAHSRHQIDRAIIASPYVPGPHIAGHSATQRLAAGLAELARRYPLSVHFIARMIAAAVRSPTSLLDGARKLYRSCPVDSIEFSRFESDPFLRAWLPEAGSVVAAGVAEDILTADEAWPESSAISTPVTILAGDHDPLIPQDVSRRLTATLSNGTHEVLPVNDRAHP